FSNTSRLTSIDRYGREATVAADGTITGGTPKRIQNMTYQGMPGHTLKHNVFEPESSGPNESGLYPTMVGDLNGDGYQELYGFHTKKGAYDVEYGVQSYDTEFSHYSFNPDGTKKTFKTEHVLTNSTQTNYYDQSNTYLRQFEGVLNPDTMYREIPFYITTKRVTQEENGFRTTYYGFGRRGIIAPNSTGSYGFKACSSQESYFKSVCDSFPSSVGVAGATGLSWVRRIVDYDGDGIAEMLMPMAGGDHHAEGPGYSSFFNVLDLKGNGRARIFIDRKQLDKTGSNWTESGTQIPTDCDWKLFVGAVDLNGDGIQDLVQAINGEVKQVCLGTGRSFKWRNYNIPRLHDGGFFNDDWRGGHHGFADFDNDGKADLYTVNYGSEAQSHGGFGAFKVYALQVGADRTLNATQYSGLNQSYTALVGDFNGDGLPDMVGSWSALAVSNANSGNPNLLRSVKLEAGGVVSVDYTPSSRFENDYLPQVLHAVTKLSVD
ncbi:FG-GAP repeat domain-containing protein, partial [Oryzicola mucosus]